LGEQIKIKFENNEPYLIVPNEILPREIRPKPVRKKTVETVVEEKTTYIYGGGVIVTPDGVEIRRTGIWGHLPIPVDLKLLAIYHDNKWIPVTEQPILHPVPWTAGRWRAQIPAQIRYKYKIMPNEKVRISYSKVVERFIVPKRLRLYHLGRIYYVPYNEKYKSYAWHIPHDNICREAIDMARKYNITGYCECFFNSDNDTLEVDIVFDNEKYLSSLLGYAYRNMAVRNYTTTETTDYPFLAEFRATMLSVCPREFYQDRERHMKLIDALRITVENIVMFFTRSIRHAETEGAIEYVTTPVLEFEETEGEEENTKVSYGEIQEYPFNHAIKYVRIINEQVYKRREGEEYIYLDKEIEEHLSAHPMLEIIRGFIWIKR